MVINCDLLEDRYISAEIRVRAPINITTHNLAFNLQYVTPDFIQTTIDLGDYGPILVAEEYAGVAVKFVPFLGYAPVTLIPTFDRRTSVWLNADTLLVVYNQDSYTDWNVTSQSYNLFGIAFRNTFIFVFENSTSSRVKRAFLTQDPGQSEMFRLFTSSIPVEVMCAAYIIPACNGSDLLGGYRPYLVDTGYTSVADCVTKMNTIQATTPCPYILRSNTRECRGTIHGPSAIFLPEVHCQHTSLNSTVCVDTCLPACANCHSNATCVPTFPTLTAAVYQCKCKNGYVGNGTHCELLICNNGHCPAPRDTFTCVDSFCTCNPTFSHDPLNEGNDYCVCPEGKHIEKNGTDLLCIPDGRCIVDQRECKIQNYNEVKCLDLGENIYSPLNHCVCNYGFEGRNEFDCVCPTGRRKEWSNLHNGKICISDSECTENWHCDHPDTCDIGVNATIGVCN